MPEVQFQNLVDACYAKVFYHSLKVLRSDHDAADVTQNTFLKAFICYGTLKDRDNPEPWLFTICNNEIGQLRRGRAKSVPQPEVRTRAAEPATDHTALYVAIERLPDAQRQVVMLKYFAGYSMREISLATAVEESTVKSRLYEARQALKRMLDGMEFTLPKNKDRRHRLMSMLNLIEAGSKTIPCMSLKAQKQLVQCAKENAKFSEAVLAELAEIQTGQDFLAACGGKLSYDELVRILSCCDEATLLRIAGTDYRARRNSVGNELIGDVTALYKTGGYVDSIETILYVPSMVETAKWYKKYLGWNSLDNIDEEAEQWGHLVVSPYSNENVQYEYREFKGFHLRSDLGGKLSGSNSFIFVSGLEAIRDIIVSNGWDKLTEIYHNCWGTKSFHLTDLNGFDLEFCEWEC